MHMIYKYNMKLVKLNVVIKVEFLKYIYQKFERDLRILYEA